MATRDVLTDSGVLISLTAGCLDGILNYFAENHNVRYIIPPSVEFETVTKPMQSNLRKHLFSAIRIKDMIDNGIVVVVDAKVEDETRKIMDSANNLFFIRGSPLRLIQYGESELFALGRELGIDYMLIDERTARLLVEAPFRLKEHMEMEFQVNVM